MFENEHPSWEESDEQFQEVGASPSGAVQGASCDARRRIERLRELRRLQDLLDDPQFDDLD